MNSTLWIILHIAAVVILALIPAFVLIRDWKFHDKLRRFHRSVTWWILAIWLVAAITIGISTWRQLSRRDKTARLSLYLNGQAIDSGQHIPVRKSGDQHILNFGVRNTGDGSADNLTLHFFYPSFVTNIVVLSGDWHGAPAKGLQGGEWQDLSIIQAISTTTQQPIHPKRGGFVCSSLFWQPAVTFAVTQQVMVIASARDAEETRHIFSIVLLPEQNAGH